MTTNRATGMVRGVKATTETRAARITRLRYAVNEANRVEVIRRNVYGMGSREHEQAEARVLRAHRALSRAQVEGER